MCVLLLSSCVSGIIDVKYIFSCHYKRQRLSDSDYQAMTSYNTKHQRQTGECLDYHLATVY